MFEQSMLLNNLMYAKETHQQQLSEPLHYNDIIIFTIHEHKPSGGYCRNSNLILSLFLPCYKTFPCMLLVLDWIYSSQARYFEELKLEYIPRWIHIWSQDEEMGILQNFSFEIQEVSKPDYDVCVYWTADSNHARW